MIVAVMLAVALLVCGVAQADNYTYKRTRSGDSMVGSMTLRKSDFPAQLRLIGGRVKPDETPSADSCNGYVPKESDLVVTGDAESRFHDSAKTMVVDSEVSSFESSAMAATDVLRGKRMLAPACQVQAAKQEHVKLVSYKILGRPSCSCNFSVSVMLEAKTSNPKLNLLLIITAVRKGRLEATVTTTVGETTNSAQSSETALGTALEMQGLALKATLPRVGAA